MHPCQSWAGKNVAKRRWNRSPTPAKIAAPAGPQSGNESYQEETCGAAKPAVLRSLRQAEVSDSQSRYPQTSHREQATEMLQFKWGWGAQEQEAGATHAMTQTPQFSFRGFLDHGDEHQRAYATADVRGEAPARWIAHLTAVPGESVVLDLGAGSGLISFALSKVFKHVIAGDLVPDNVLLIRRESAQRRIGNLHPIVLNGLRLPFQESAFDAIVVNGVFEWAGVNERGHDPRRLQDQFLRETNRVLRPGGLMYLAIENRAALQNLLRDPHTKRPFLLAVPYSFADQLSRLLYKAPFQVHIYTPWELKKLLHKAGFDTVQFFTPLPSYQFPTHFLPLFSQESSSDSLSTIDKDRLQAALDLAGYGVSLEQFLRRVRRRLKWRILPFLSRDIVALCHKGRRVTAQPAGDGRGNGRG